MLADLPEVRQDRIDEIRQQIASGNYETRLPPGRYEISVIRVGGGHGRVMNLDFTGKREVRLDLSAR